MSIILEILWKVSVIASLLVGQSGEASGQINKEALRNQKQIDSGKYRKFETMQLNLRNQKKKIKEKQDKAARLNMQYSMNGTRFCEKSLPIPNDFLSMTSYKGSVVPIGEAERKGFAKCSFLGAVCPTEATEHSLVDRYLIPSDTVLEVGARFGTTSCAIAEKQQNSGRLISVEPDYRVWNLLDENRIRHNCNFWLLRGVISDQPAVISGTFYSTRSISSADKTATKGSENTADTVGCPTQRTSNTHTAEVNSKRHYTFDEIQVFTKLTFSALLIDCEGCINTLFRGNTKTLSTQLRNVNTIILEADMPIGALDCTHDCVDYTQWIKDFAEAGLKVVFRQQDPVFTKIYHYVFKRNVNRV